MARNTDELVTLLTLEGDGAFASRMRNAGSGLNSFVAKHEKFLGTMSLAAPYAEQAGTAMASWATENAKLYAEAETVDSQLRAMYQRRGFGEEAVQDVEKFSLKLQDMAGINDDVTKKSAALMASFGVGPKEFVELAPYMASQADLMGTSMDSVALAVGKAFGSGQYGALKRYGITLGAAEMQQLKYAQALTASGDAQKAAEGRAIAYGIVLNAMKNYTPELTARMGTLKGQQDRFNATLENVRETMGSGIGDMQRFSYSVGSDLLNAFSKTSPAVQRGAGELIYLAGGALKAVGWVGNLSRDLVSMQAAMNLAKGATSAASVAQSVATGATVAQTGATAASVPVVGAATAANTSLAASLWAAYAPAIVMVAAIGALALAYRDLAVYAEAARERDYAHKVDEGRKKSADTTGFVYNKDGSVNWEKTKAKQKELGITSNRKALDDAGWQAGGRKNIERDRSTGTGSWFRGDYGAANQAAQAQQGRTTAQRMPGGNIRLTQETTIRGGAGISEEELDNFSETYM